MTLSRWNDPWKWSVSPWHRWKFYLPLDVYGYGAAVGSICWIWRMSYRPSSAWKLWPSISFDESSTSTKLKQDGHSRTKDENVLKLMMEMSIILRSKWFCDPIFILDVTEKDSIAFTRIKRRVQWRCLFILDFASHQDKLSNIWDILRHTETTESSQTSQMRNDEIQNRRAAVKHRQTLQITCHAHKRDILASHKNLQETSIFRVKSMFFPVNFPLIDMPRSGRGNFGSLHLETFVAFGRNCLGGW